MYIVFMGINVLVGGVLIYGWLSVLDVHGVRRRISQHRDRYAQTRPHASLVTLKVNLADWRIHMSSWERLEQKLLARTGLQFRFPGVTVPLVLLGIFLVSLLSGVIAFTALGDGIVACIATGLSVAGPFFAMEMAAHYRNTKIRRELADFLAILHRWAAVKEDVLFAFEKSLDSGISEPLRSMVRDFVIQVKKGMPVEDALEMLTFTVDQPHFRTAMLSIQQALLHRGNIVIMLENLSWEAFKLEDEYNRRRISTVRDRVMLFGVSAGSLLAVFAYMSLNASVKTFYTDTSVGGTVLFGAGVLFSGGLLLSFGMGKFKY